MNGRPNLVIRVPDRAWYALGDRLGARQAEHVTEHFVSVHVLDVIFQCVLGDLRDGLQFKIGDLTSHSPGLSDANS